MQNSTIKAILACMIMLAALASSQACPKGQIKIAQNCIECKTLQNVRLDDVQYFSTQTNQCPCKQGFLWSSSQLNCVVQANPRRAVLSFSQPIENNESQTPKVSRILQGGTCDSTLGFIPLGGNSSCTNCRVLPYAMGVTLSTTDCACAPNYYWSSPYCFCDYLNYIDASTGMCSPCSTLPSASFSACKGRSLPFVYSKFGGILCTSLANNGGSSACCATGYTFSSPLGICKCNSGSKYAINANGICAKCASTDSNCNNCVNNYVYNGHYCIHGSLVTNFDTTAMACKTGYAFKLDPYSNLTLGCACSYNAGYYQNGANCAACSVIRPSGVSLSDCQSCSTSAGFYMGFPDCIYCKGDSNSLGTATNSGCDCKPNYYFNTNTGKCECDWTIGYVGGATSSCTVCSSLPNTDNTVNPTGCSCVRGYKWNTATSTCDCDTSSPAIFKINGNCIDCSTMIGGSGAVDSSLTSCVCTSSYFWNVGKNKCDCDATQNFVAFYDGFCSDCMIATMSNGLAYGQQCACQNYFIWDSSTSTCICPSGYFVLGTICYKCSTYGSFPSGTAASDCSSCLTAKSFFTISGICYYCSNGLINGVCSCKDTGQFWISEINNCGCAWDGAYVSAVNPNGTVSCLYCPLSSGGYCYCTSTKGYTYSNGVCTYCKQDPNGGVDTKGRCVCNSGYTWSDSNYPFRCVPSYSAGSYINAGGATGALCSSLSSTIQGYCSTCDSANGFLLVSGINQCLYCASDSGSTGKSLYYGCECKTNFKWNAVSLKCDSVTGCATGYIYNPITKACDICDPVKSVIVGTACVSCTADPNSLGYAATSSACACKPSYPWTASANSGSCSSTTSCSTTTSIWIGTVCFPCPSTNNGAGQSASATACKCNNGYTWLTSGSSGSCICNSATSVVISGACVACPTNANSTGLPTTSRSGCQCSNNFIWSSSRQTCICDSTVNSYVTSSGACFQCLTANDPNFDGTIVGGACNCLNAFKFIGSASGGNCVCASPAVVLPSGICAICPKNTNTTGGYDTSGVCACNNNYVWVQSKSTCICDSTVSAYINNGTCFICKSTVDANFDGTIASGVCKCKNSFIFNTSTLSCNCDSPKFVSNGICSSCPTNSNTTGAADLNSTCLCNKNYIWDNTKKTCICDASISGIILANGNCFQCLSFNDPNFDGTITASKCNCINGFTFVANATGNSSCKCLSPAFMSGTNCVTCSVGTTPDGKGGCTCSNNFIWNAASGTCICDPTTSFLLTTGACFTCGADGTFTSVKQGSACTCTSKSLTWNKDAYICDCGRKSALIATGNNFVCVSCSSRVNAVSKATPYSCTCNSNVLTWSTTTNQCDCGPRSVYVNSACIACDASLYANGQDPAKPSTCRCLISDMTWNKNLLTCACSSSAVVFNVGGTLSCQTCNSAIFAVKSSRASVIACNCFDGSVWVPNVGCVCTGQNTVPVIVGSNTSCIVCDASVYSTGPSDDGKSCACMGSLTWPSKATSCGCPKNVAIAVQDGQYFCSPCSTANYAKSPLVSPTQCTCSTANITWYDAGYCGCPDPLNQVLFGTGNKANCITCNADINANGKSSATATACICISPVLTFNKGTCDCGDGFAYTIQGLNTFTCIKCSNSAIYAKNKASSSACTCTSSKLAWDTISGTCNCGNSSLIVVGSGSSASCVTCTGQYVQPQPKSYNTCNCMGTGLVFSSSKALLCACPKNNILLPDFSCFLCPGGISALTPYECKCSSSFIWSYSQKKCLGCGTTDVPNSVKTGGTQMACKCNANFIWDVMTQACITPCAANPVNSTCMNCNFPESSGAAITIDTGSFVALTGWDTIQKGINGTYTNYASLSNFQCPCKTDYYWDNNRYRCYSTGLV